MRTGKAFILVFWTTLYAGAVVGAQSEVPKPHAYKLEGDIEGAHDPSIIKEGHTWYLFGTVTRKQPKANCPSAARGIFTTGNGVDTSFKNIPEWIKTASPETKDL